LVVQTQQRIELVDLTKTVMEFVRKFNMREGFVSLWSMHTTCALFINEFQVALLTDIKRFLEQMVARDAEWMHNDPEHSDCDRMNADSHLRALLLGHNLTLQVSGGGSRARPMAADSDGRARWPAGTIPPDTSIRDIVKRIGSCPRSRCRPARHPR
jgi:secondary thiamine-phosphate synthase enzyme